MHAIFRFYMQHELLFIQKLVISRLKHNNYKVYSIIWNMVLDIYKYGSYKFNCFPRISKV